MGSDYLQVTIAFLNLAQELLETIAESGAFGKPEGQAGTYFLRESEKLHLFAELAVVTFLGLFEKGEIFVEHGFLGEGNAINAHELVALFITAPECAGERCDFGSLDGSCRGDVRAAAKIGEITLCIGGDMTVFKLGDKLAFVFLVFVAEEFERVVFAYIRAHNLLVLLGKLKHFSLDFGEVVA